jgi:structural maintenance of chromosome 3 (chondroitin sulfate proteoglycan 6)
MYIKQIIIQGFKSYKEQLVIEEFSPKVNVIVGRNGAGKSNFFSAVRFILGDDYTNIGREERQALLHEGSGRAVVTAYVEVIFDNSDDRFHTGKSELILRRTIGLKKDEYSLDRKNVTKKEVENILETAGFSSANPYYIVPQGRVTKITNMKDGDRLDLLKTVAGTKVYEERRQKSLRIMTDTDHKRKAIDDLLETINKRLEELEGEMAELRQYNALDKERRALEFTFHTREQKDAQRKLDDLTQLRQNRMDTRDDKVERMEEASDALEALAERIASTQQQIDRFTISRKDLETQRRELVQEKAQWELQVRELTDSKTRGSVAQAERNQERAALEKEIQKIEAELAQIIPKYASAKDQDDSKRAQLDSEKLVLRKLQEKQGRHFENKGQRDAYLQKQIDEINAVLSSRKAHTMELRDNIESLQNEITGLESSIAELDERLVSRDNDEQALSGKYRMAKETVQELDDQRKLAQRRLAELDSKCREAAIEQEKAESALYRQMNSETRMALINIPKIVNRLRLKGVYGTVADIITKVNKTHELPVEYISGASLFHYVVEDEKTAKALADVLQKERLGRITFIILEQVQVKPNRYPQADDAKPLLDGITYDPKFEKAMQRVFGNAIVCPELHIAQAYARSHGVKAITPNGDEADKSGTMTGGHNKEAARNSRYALNSKVRERREMRDNLEQELVDLREETSRLNQKITKAKDEEAKLERQKEQAKTSHVPLAQEKLTLVRRKQQKQDEIEQLQDSLGRLQNDTAVLEHQLEEHEHELSTPFQHKLSKDEQRRLNELPSAIRDLEKACAQLRAIRNDYDLQKTRRETELRSNLRPRLMELAMQDSENIASASVDTDLLDAQRELQRRQKALLSTIEDFKKAEKSIEHYVNELATYQSKRDKWQRKYDEITREIAQEKKRLENSANEQQILKEQLEEATRALLEIPGMTDEDAKKYPERQWSKEKVSITRLSLLRSY